MSKKNTCTHSVRYLSEGHYVEDDWTGEQRWEPGEWHTRSTCVDLDTHRYQCTQCKEIMYYSGAARDYYEKGTDHWAMHHNTKIRDPL